MKRFSKTFSIQINKNDLQSQQLAQTMQQLIQKQQEIIQQKLMRQQQIQNRLKKIEKDFQQLVEQKQNKIKNKIQRSQKNRHNFLEKIVKKCKDKQRFFNQKLKILNTKKKQSLRQAWRAATKFNQKILQSKSIKHKSLQRQHKVQKQNCTDDLAKSILISDQVVQDKQTKEQNLLQVPGSNIKNNSKGFEFINRNMGKSFDHIIFQSTFQHEKKSTLNSDKKSERPAKVLYTQSHKILNSDKIREIQQNPQNSYQQKLKQTLMRYKQHMIDQQKKKIQECGQRLQKIKLSRRKKDEIHKSRLRQRSIQNDQGYYGSVQRQDEKPSNLKKKLNQRLKSESQSYDRIKRASDWSQHTKSRRQELLLTHIQQGNRYLSQNRIRHLKQIMSKNMAYNAIQKKLYRERLRNIGA